MDLSIDQKLELFLLIFVLILQVFRLILLKDIFCKFFFILLDFYLLF